MTEEPLMTESITIKYNAGARDDIAGKETVWTTLVTQNAMVIPVGGDLSVLAGELDYHDLTEFHVDYTTFNTAYSATAEGRMLRINYGGRDYRVTGKVDAGNLHQVIILTGAIAP